MSDVFSSLNYFLGTWLIPKGERSVFGGPIYGASGTKATCQLSGFLTQFSIASPLYNGTLALYYLKTIYYNHQEKDLYKSEKWLHTIPLTYAFLTALIGLIFNLYGSMEWLCWIKPTSEQNMLQKEYRILQWIIFFVPIWICILFQSIVMYLLFQKMRDYEKKMDKYEFEHSAHLTNKRLLPKKSSKESSAISMKENIPSFVSNIGKMIEVSRLSGFETFFASEVVNAENDMNVGLTGEKDCMFPVDDETPNCLQFVESCSGYPTNVRQGITANLTYNSSIVGDNPYSYTMTKEELCSSDESLNKKEQKFFVGKSNISNSTLPPVCNEEFEIDRSEQIHLETIDEQSENEVGLAERRVSFIKNLTNFMESEDSRSRDKESLSSLEENIEIDIVEEIKDEKPTIVEKSFRNMMSSFSDRVSRSSGGSSFKQNIRSRQIAIQGMLYISAFLMTWFFPTVQKIATSRGVNFFALQILDVTRVLQGFFNFVVYIRPRVMKHREANPADGLWVSLKTILFHRA